jgi:hypothetical protein
MLKWGLSRLFYIFSPPPLPIRDSREHVPLRRLWESIICFPDRRVLRVRMIKNAKNTCDRLLILTDLGMVRVLSFKEAGDDPRDLAHLKELSENELGAPRGADTTDGPGRFNRGSSAGNGEAMSHAETKLNVEVEKRAIAQVAKEICDVVANLGCSSFTLAAPQEHLKRLKTEMDANSREKLQESFGADFTKTSLKDLEKRFL